MKETYPMALRVYKGEGRILIVPVVHHVYGYSVVSDQYYNIEEDVSVAQLGETIQTAIRFVMNSHLSTATPKERDENAAWKKNTKYKSEISFWKNNHFARVHYDEEGQYHIYSLKRSGRRKGAYEDRICQEDLPCNSSAEEIGAAVLEVLRASESYYKKYKASAKEPHREIELAGGTKLIFNEPSGTEWEDDLLLECSVEVREPRRRKTSDQKISKQFKELSGSCRLA